MIKLILTLVPEKVLGFFVVVVVVLKPDKTRIVPFS